jgi:hypothetical protein
MASRRLLRFPVLISLTWLGWKGQALRQPSNGSLDELVSLEHFSSATSHEMKDGACLSAGARHLEAGRAFNAVVAARGT